MSRRALLIGIENYPGKPLKGCATDAAALYKLLVQHEDKSRNFDAEIFTDEIKTHANLRKCVKNLFKGKYEIALFYFSGHGAISDTGSYLVTPDWDEHDKGMPVSELLKLAADSESDTKIIILDCCHAGAAGDFISRNGVNIISDDMIILAACGDEEFAVMVNGHSVFTNLLLQALKGASADLCGNISPASVYALIDQSLGALDQRPVFKAVVDHLVTLRKVTPPVPVEDLREISKLFNIPDEQFPLDKTYVEEESVAKKEKVLLFKILQRLNRVGLVIPDGEEHMFWAAMNEKSCSLTPMGKHYWYMANKNRF